MLLVRLPTSALSNKYSRLLVSSGDVAPKLLRLLLVLHLRAASRADITARADERRAPVVTCGYVESRDMVIAAGAFF